MPADHEGVINDTIYLLQRSNLPVGELPAIMVSREQLIRALTSAVERITEEERRRMNIELSQWRLVDKQTAKKKNAGFYRRNREQLIGSGLVAFGIALLITGSQARDFGSLLVGCICCAFAAVVLTDKNKPR